MLAAALLVLLPLAAQSPAESLAALEVTGVAGGSAGGLKDSFDVLFDGKPTGAAGLWMDRRGRPERRQQTVNFPGGRMYVEERYTWH